MKSVFTALILAMLLVSCDEDEVNTLSGEWKLTHTYNLQTNKIEAEPAGAGMPVILNFSDDGKSGNIKGHTTINPVQAQYQLGPKKQIAILSLSGSEFTESIWGEVIWSRMPNANRYKVADNVLYIYCHKNQEVLLFSKQ